jgi:hypothetical protein
MAKRRPLTRDVYTFKIKHMTKHGSTPTTATDFYKAVEESGSDKLWLEKHGLDGIS